jgi:hypothetical protein
MLASDPNLAKTSPLEAPFPGWTGLHEAGKQGHLEAVRLLIKAIPANFRPSWKNPAALRVRENKAA